MTDMYDDPEFIRETDKMLAMDTSKLHKDPKTAEEWCHEAFYVSDIYARPIKDEVTSVIRRAQEQARKEILDKLTAEDGGNEFAMVCHLKEKLAEARREAIEECAELAFRLCDCNNDTEDKILALLNKN